MPRRILFTLLLCSAPICAQDLGHRSLPLPPGNPKFQTNPKNSNSDIDDPAQQLATCQQLADKGDATAAFQMGMTYLIGQGLPQDASKAEEYFKKAEMTPSRMCMVAETYMETSMVGRIEAANRWVRGDDSSCADWVQSQWYRTNQLGPNPSKEIEFLKRGLATKDEDYHVLIRARLGEIILKGATVPASHEEQISWIGSASRMQLGQSEFLIALYFEKHAEESDSIENYLHWIRSSARYGFPNALATLGQAAISREVSDLTFLDGLSLYTLGMRQNFLTSTKLDSDIKSLEPEQREELANGIAAWQRTARASGGYYSKNDPLRLTEDFSLDALIKSATSQDPDAQLRLAYFYESSGQFKEAEDLYREVWLSGPGELGLQIGDRAAKVGKWPAALDLYFFAAEAGSHPACLALAHIYGEGLGVNKSEYNAYLWLLRSGSKDPKFLSETRGQLTALELKTININEAQWVLKHKEHWPTEVKAAQAIVDAQQVSVQSIPFKGQFPPGPANEELRRKADGGDPGSAYLYAINLLSNRSDEHPTIALIEHYATAGALNPEQKAHIAWGYESANQFDAATQRKYAMKWWLAVGGSRSYYELGKLFNGKSDGFVQTDDEKQAVKYWQLSANEGDARWARLSRMELGYRVDKGWTSGNRVNDAAWAHELAMEFLGKELYQVAGEYSYGKELEHDRITYLTLAERAAIYNIDNAQGQIAEAINGGEWAQRDSADAYAWMILRATKQDVDDLRAIQNAESNPELKKRIESTYALMLKARSESGAYFPQNDPLRTATIAELEPRAALGDPEAQLRLATRLEQQATEESLNRAIAIHRQLWATSGQEVRLNLGRSLMYGTGGFTRNDKGAEKWLWDAANAGSHPACGLLAAIYKEGRGVAADPIAAEVWVELYDPSAKPQSTLSDAEKSAIAAKVADWKSKHPNW